MIIFSLCLGVACFLIGFPMCRINYSSTELFPRLQTEQYKKFQTAFAVDPTGVHRTILGEWVKKRQVLQRFGHVLGIDEDSLRASLQRLPYVVDIHDIVAGKLFGGFLFLCSLFYVAWGYWANGNAGMEKSLFVLVGLVMYLLPTWLVEWADRRERQRIQRQLPIFFSIVQVLVEAGLPLQSAVQTTSKRFPERLGREMEQLEEEAKKHGSWRKALEIFALKWDIEALYAIVSDINETLTKGTTIAPLLAIQVEEQLRQQEDKAIERMNNLNITLLPVLILFMGVPLLFLVLGPSFVQMKLHL